MSVTTTPLTATIGAEIDGMKGRELVDPWVAGECLALLDRYGVLVYREANVSDAELVNFSRLLGDVVLNPTGEHEYREIATITLDPTKTHAELAWYRQGNFLWHIDGATDELPQKATLLSAREVDEEGGDTEFATTYAAYEALTDAEKSEIAELRVLHSFAAAQRRVHPDASDAKQADWARVPNRVHPWSGRIEVDGNPSCSVLPPLKSSGGRQRREQHYSIGFSIGRPRDGSSFGIAGDAVISSSGTTRACSIERCGSSPPHAV